MAKEREEWQFIEDGQWQTADKRFTIIESQSGEHHHLVDNQKLRNSKTCKTFAECDEYAWQIRTGQVEIPAGRNHRKHDEDNPDRSARTNGNGRGGSSGHGQGKNAHAEEKPEGEGGRARRMADRSDRRESEQGAGRASAKTGGQDGGRSRGGHGQGAAKDTANAPRTAEKTARRKRHHHKSVAAQPQGEKEPKEYRKRTPDAE